MLLVLSLSQDNRAFHYKIIEKGTKEEAKCLTQWNLQGFKITSMFIDDISYKILQGVSASIFMNEWNYYNMITFFCFQSFIKTTPPYTKFIQKYKHFKQHLNEKEDEKKKHKTNK